MYQTATGQPMLPRISVCADATLRFADASVPAAAIIRGRMVRVFHIVQAINPEPAVPTALPMHLSNPVNIARAPIAGENLLAISFLARLGRSLSSLAARPNCWIATLVLGTILASAPLPAQTADTGTIEGRVSNSASGAYLGNVRVAVEGTTRETITDATGFFRLTGVPAGSARVSASYVGLESRTDTISVPPGRAAELNFALTRGGQPSTDGKDVVKMSEFTVIEERERSAQTLALNQQRQSPNIKNVVASDVYPTGSDDNIADFLQFIPGVSIGYSGRAGIDASVRGMPSDTSGITMDGVELSGAWTGNTRTVTLLAVPTTNISTIEVTKVPTPDMPAQGLGGSINITTRSGFERAKPLFKYNLYSAFDPQYGISLKDRTSMHTSMEAPSVRPSFEVSYLHPVNKSLSLSLSGANKLNYNANPHDTTAGWDLVQGFPTSFTLTNSGVQLVKVRSGLIGVDWKLGEKNIFKASVSYRTRDADQGVNAQTITYGAGARGGPTFTQGAATGVGSLGQGCDWQNLVTYTTHALLKYTHLGDTWKIDASGSYSYSSFYQVPDYTIGYFAGMSVSLPNLVIRGEGVDGTATRAVDLQPDTVTVRDRAGNTVSPQDARLYSVNSVTSGERGSMVDKAQFRVDLRRELRLAIPFTIQTGGSIVQEAQKLWNWGRSYSFRPTASVADRMAGNYDLIDTTYSQSLAPLLGSQVQWVSSPKLFQLSRTRPDYFVLNEAAAHQLRVTNSKKLVETISATYFRADTRLLNNRLWLVAGVRYERTDDEGRGPLVNPAAQFVKSANGSLAKDAAGRFIPLTTDALSVARLVYIERGTHQKTNYDGFFPSLNASYNIKDDLVLRLGYAQTIGRPNLPFIIPGATYSTIAEASTRQTITVVNNRLKPWMGNNYDVSLESYLIKDGFGSIGVFQKDLSNFFTTTTLIGTPELLDQYGVVAAGGDALSYDLVTRGNGGDARVRGMEFTYRQSLTFLPRWARGIQGFVNYTRSTLSGSTTADFTGFNPQTLSWGVNFTRPRYAVTFSSTEQKESKRAAVATSAVNPVGTYGWQGALKRYTLGLEYSVSRRLGFYASMSDFNAPGGLVTIQKRYAPGTPVDLRTTRVTEWGQGVILGIKGEF
jgi:iron complex outermembrane receptor protein